MPSAEPPSPTSRGESQSAAPSPEDGGGALVRGGHGPLARHGLRLILIGATGLAFALHWESNYLGDVQTMLASMRAEVGIDTLLVLTAVYAVALACPFVPGMELGLLLMVTFGPRGVLRVYAATLLGLSLSYAAGRVMAIRLTRSGSRAHPAATPPSELDHTLHGLLLKNRFGRYIPTRLVAWLATHRYLALGISLNLPGNTVVGGGGGIALLCGLSGQYSYQRYLVTVAMAISPLPILMLISTFGFDVTELGAHLTLAARDWLNFH